MWWMIPNRLILDEHHDSCFSGHFAPRKMKQRVSQSALLLGWDECTNIQEVGIMYSVYICQGTRI